MFREDDGSKTISQLHMGKTSLGVVVACLLIFSLAGCSVGQKPAPVARSAPQVTIDSPTTGQELPSGEQILVQSTSIDSDGIQRIELWVDDQMTRVDVNPDLGETYVVAQPWQSTEPGSHVIIVKAFDVQQAEGASKPVVVNIPSPPTSSPGVPASTVPTITPSNTLQATFAPTGAPDTPNPTSPAIEASLTPTITLLPVCTPPLCGDDEVYYCPDLCPGGCGTQCATPTAGASSFEPTGFEVHDILEPIWNQSGIKDRLGYPTEDATANRKYARQYFSQGFLYWLDRPESTGLIWAIETPDPAASQGIRWAGPFEDMWNGEDPYSCDAARANTYGPKAGFGALWCEHTEIAKAIGAARDPEQGTGESNNYGLLQQFQGGTMLYSPIDREVWVLFKGEGWQRYPI